MGIYKYYTELPPWAKGLSIVALLGGSYLAYKGIKKGIENKNKKQSEQQFIKDIQKDIDAQAQPPTTIQTNYNQLADSLYIALNSYNTDEAAVYRTFLIMKNKADVLKLIQAFGKRTRTGIFNLDEDLTLNGFITEAMNFEEIAQLNYILAKKGINYYF